MNTYHSYNSQNLVNCSMDQPLQNLQQKLSSKSSQLYIFWQNYNQLYTLYQEKSTEIIRLRQEIITLRSQYQTPKVQMIDDSFLKERYLNLEKNFEDVRLENERVKNQCKQLRKQTSRFHEENIQLQSLLQQLRDENNVQRQSIEKILNQLKSAQGELSTYSKLYEQIQHKQMQIAVMNQNEKQLNEIISQREEEIEQLIESSREMKVHYENLLREAMQNAKIKVIQSLPSLIKTSKHKVQVIAN